MIYCWSQCHWYSWPVPWVQRVNSAITGCWAMRAKCFSAHTRVYFARARFQLLTRVSWFVQRWLRVCFQALRPSWCGGGCGWKILPGHWCKQWHWQGYSQGDSEERWAGLPWSSQEAYRDDGRKQVWLSSTYTQTQIPGMRCHFTGALVWVRGLSTINAVKTGIRKPN